MNCFYFIFCSGLIFNTNEKRGFEVLLKNGFISSSNDDFTCPKDIWQQNSGTRKALPRNQDPEQKVNNKFKLPN